MSVLVDLKPLEHSYATNSIQGFKLYMEAPSAEAQFNSAHSPSCYNNYNVLYEQIVFMVSQLIITLSWASHGYNSTTLKSAGCTSISPCGLCIITFTAFCHPRSVWPLLLWKALITLWLIDIPLKHLHEVCLPPHCFMTVPLLPRTTLPCRWIYPLPI